MGWPLYCALVENSDLWTKDERQLHINVLELRVVRLTRLHQEQDVLGQMILIGSDNTATVSYINRQGGVVSKTLNEAYSLFEWLIPRSIRVKVIHTGQVSTSWQASCCAIAQTPQSGASQREWCSCCFSCGGDLRWAGSQLT